MKWFKGFLLGLLVMWNITLTGVFAIMCYITSVTKPVKNKRTNYKSYYSYEKD